MPSCLPGSAACPRVQLRSWDALPRGSCVCTGAGSASRLGTRSSEFPGAGDRGRRTGEIPVLGSGGRWARWPQVLRYWGSARSVEICCWNVILCWFRWSSCSMWKGLFSLFNRLPTFTLLSVTSSLDCSKAAENKMDETDVGEFWKQWLKRSILLAFYCKTCAGNPQQY